MVVMMVVLMVELMVELKVEPKDALMVLRMADKLAVM
jgi:hypothetical protein